MINVMCVKIGDKYDVEYVNRLLKMCKATISRPFTFLCYTDDKAGINEDVVCIEVVDDYYIVNPVFNKLFLLSDEFARKHLNSDICVYFDLDVVIKSSVDFLFEPWSPELRVIQTAWKDAYHTTLGAPNFIHDINSSCMTWQRFHTNHFWQTFIEDKESFLKMYRGMDQYLYFTKNVRGGLPDKFHSHIYGFTSSLMSTFWDEKTKSHIIKRPADPLKNYPVCLLNGDTTIVDYMYYYKKVYTD